LPEQRKILPASSAYISPTGHCLQMAVNHPQRGRGGAFYRDNLVVI
jgi:hypothetical protein